MRKSTRILSVVLLINAVVVMAAGMLLGPDTAGSAFFVIGIGLGAHAAHQRERKGRQDMKTGVMTLGPRHRGIAGWRPTQETSRRPQPLPGMS